MAQSGKVAELNGKPAATNNGTPHLSRVLGLWDVVFYGMVLAASPMATVPLFGVSQEASHGFMVTCLMIAMAAMAITAVSYGRLAAVYPSSGSAYTYITRTLNPHLGFLIGWLLVLDYLEQPILNSIMAALTFQRLIPQVPYVLLAAICVALITFLNLRSIRATATVNQILLAAMTAVIGVFIIMAIRYLWHRNGWGGLFSTQPFYDPRTFQMRAIATGTSLAALTFIGFDAVTLLTEETKNPKRNILRAGVLVCIFTGVFCGLEAYLAQRVWPDYRQYPHVETAFMDVSRIVGHTVLFNAIAVNLLIMSLACGLTGQLGAARLLFSMGRDNVLPRRPFGYLGKTNVPSVNVLIVGAIAFLFTQIFTYELAAELLNFGAFLAFMGVNASCFAHFYWNAPQGHKRRLFKDAVVPLAGFLFSLWIWCNVSRPAKIQGTIWIALGLLYAAIKTRGFRAEALTMDFRES